MGGDARPARLLIPMPSDRFDHLEENEKPQDEIKKTVSNFTRFRHLEIGVGRVNEPSEPAPAIKRLCGNCGQYNGQERSICWACFRPLADEAKPAPAKTQQDITLVIDGTTYTSSDPALPPEIKELMDRISLRGYSAELLSDWQNWRATRNEPALRQPQGPHRGEDAARGINVFKGLRVSVIKLDGKVYTSDDANLSPEIKQLFVHLDCYGVTPALMDELRAVGGGKVEMHPATTANPSDADLKFWDDVTNLRLKEDAARGGNFYFWLAAAILGLIAAFGIFR